MKNMNLKDKRGSLHLLLGAVAVGLLSITGVHADTTYTTHTSDGKPIATFTQVEGPGKFGQSWRDPNGIIWSANLGNYLNGGYNDNTIITGSPANTACEDIGGHLPPVDQYFKLLSFFETKGYPAFTNGTLLTAQGLKDLNTVFGTCQRFWTRDARI